MAIIDFSIILTTLSRKYKILVVQIAITITIMIVITVMTTITVHVSFFIRNLFIRN